MGIVDRLLTIIVTATVTSAAWIVVGNSYFDRQVEESDTSIGATAPAPAPTTEVALPDPEEQLLIPVAGIDRSDLSDTFNDRREDRQHEALDIMAPAGTAVLSAAPGTVEKLFQSDAGGNTVYVRSADRLTIYYYAHLQAYADGLKEGQTVRRGQRIGSVGTSGNANPAGPHLHFEVLATSRDAQWWEAARPLNPYNLLTEQE
jgi:murein DD-endopeptidase MepM/ murein hydrolase activator NlpD